MNKTRYTVTTLRSGQLRPYAPSEYEYLVEIEYASGWGPDPDRLKPWLMYGNPKEEQIRVMQERWAKGIIKSLCHGFCGEDEGDWASPRLKWIWLDTTKGTIHALITEAYTG
jgi:hypothetical protein